MTWELQRVVRPFDRLSIATPPDIAVTWSEGQQPVQLAMILVNDIPLIELVRQEEQTFAEMEWDDDVAQGTPLEVLGERGSLAGQYMYHAANAVLAPSRELLGERSWEVGPRGEEQICLLGCACGIVECWPFLAEIVVSPSLIVWQHFEQPHRNWRYGLGPFIFDRAQYESALGF